MVSRILKEISSVEVVRNVVNDVSVTVSIGMVGVDVRIEQNVKLVVEATLLQD